MSTFRAWKKIFVEPIPPIFKELASNVEKVNDPQAFLVNAAIVDHGTLMKSETKTIEMHCWKLSANGNIDYEAFRALGLEADSWMASTCSLDRDRLLSKYDYGQAENFTESQKNSLLTTYSVRMKTVEQTIGETTGVLNLILYLQIDAEGWDCKLLKSMPWHRRDFRPALVNYEFVICSEQEVVESHELMEGLGYKLLTRDNSETWAYSKCPYPS